MENIMREDLERVAMSIGKLEFTRNDMQKTRTVREYKGLTISMYYFDTDFHFEIRGSILPMIKIGVISPYCEGSELFLEDFEKEEGSDIYAPLTGGRYCECENGSDTGYIEVFECGVDTGMFYLEEVQYEMLFFDKAELTAELCSMYKESRNKLNTLIVDKTKCRDKETIKNTLYEWGVKEEFFDRIVNDSFEENRGIDLIQKKAMNAVVSCLESFNYKILDSYQAGAHLVMVAESLIEEGAHLELDTLEYWCKHFTEMNRDVYDQDLEDMRKYIALEKDFGLDRWKTIEDIGEAILGEFENLDGYLDVNWSDLKENYKQRIGEKLISNEEILSEMISYFSCNIDQYSDDAWMLMRTAVEKELKTASYCKDEYDNFKMQKENTAVSSLKNKEIQAKYKISLNVEHIGDNTFKVKPISPMVALVEENAHFVNELILTKKNKELQIIGILTKDGAKINNDALLLGVDLDELSEICQQLCLSYKS